MFGVHDGIVPTLLSGICLQCTEVSSYSVIDPQ